jgi:hypothetical protein
VAGPGGARDRVRRGTGWVRHITTRCRDPGLEAVGDAAQAEAEAGLGCALGDAGEAGDLAEGPAFEVGEQDGGALGGRQLLDGDPDPFGHGGGDRGLLGVGRGRRFAGDGRPGRVAVADLDPAQEVDRAVVGHGGQPSPQPPTVGVEHPGPLPEVEEHLLGDVLGGRAVAGDPCRQAVDHGRELLVGLGQGERVPGHQAGAQVPFPLHEPRRLALHRVCSPCSARRPLHRVREEAGAGSPGRGSPSGWSGATERGCRPQQGGDQHPGRRRRRSPPRAPFRCHPG